MRNYDEDTIYLTVTHQYPCSRAIELVPVVINITEPDSRKWEDLDDAIEFAAQLAAELPGYWSVWLRNASSWRLIRDDGLQLRFYNGRMVRCTVEVPEAYDGSDPWRSPLYLKEEDPQEVPSANANRSRGIKAIAADFNSRVIKHADDVWATALRHARFKADELARKHQTAERVATCLGTKYRQPDGDTGVAKGQHGHYPSRAEFQVTYESHTKFTVHVGDPDMAACVANAIKEAMWPASPTEPQAQLGLFQEGEAFPLFMEMDA